MVVLKLDNFPKNCIECPLCTDHIIENISVCAKNPLGQSVYHAECNYYKSWFYSLDIEKRPELCPLEELKEEADDSVKGLKETLFSASKFLSDWGVY